jgi:hypothetical protein
VVTTAIVVYVNVIRSDRKRNVTPKPKLMNDNNEEKNGQTEPTQDDLMNNDGRNGHMEPTLDVERSPSVRIITSY